MRLAVRLMAAAANEENKVSCSISSSREINFHTYLRTRGKAARQDSIAIVLQSQ